MSEVRTCKNCAKKFEITDSDLAFYDKVSPVFEGKKFMVPPPTLCPDCREIRRLAQTNQINLYKRKCDATGKDIISNYHPSSPFKVYHQEYWWSDAWDPMQYGRDFDFKRPFFEQFKELSLAVPRPNVFTGYQYDENCEFTNGAGKNKNCYLIFDADYNQDCYYCYSLDHGISSQDCLRCRATELCYECVGSKQCYNCRYVENSSNCTDSAFLNECFSCKNCFMCFNLQHKDYYIFNKPSTKAEFEKYMKMLSSRANIEKMQNDFQQFKLKFPQKYMHGIQNENVTGDYLYNCKNVFKSFDSNEAWDCRYIYQSFGSSVKDCMDFDQCGDFAEMDYETSMCGYNANNVKFSSFCLDQVSDLMYCDHCHFSSNLFGCVGLKRKKYCILNKQYSKEDYEKLLPKIIEHMQKTRVHGTVEWGEFFPLQLSNFAYNESLAMDYAPISREEAVTKGLRWLDEEKQKTPQKNQIPDNIAQVPDAILKEILACTQCGSNFKIIPQELEFYKKLLIPIPTKCFKCRHYRRIKSRNPRKLWDRNCAKCGAGIQTSYAPDRPEIIYCEKCYLEAVY